MIQYKHCISYVITVDKHSSYPLESYICLLKPNLGPTGSRWAPCWPHELCYLGRVSYFGRRMTIWSPYNNIHFPPRWKYLYSVRLVLDLTGNSTNITQTKFFKYIEPIHTKVYAAFYSISPSIKSYDNDLPSVRTMALIQYKDDILPA